MDFNSNINKLKILQINLQKSKYATSTADSYIYEEDIDIVLAQELYLIKDRVSLFPLNF